MSIVETDVFICPGEKMLMTWDECTTHYCDGCIPDRTYSVTE